MARNVPTVALTAPDDCPECKTSSPPNGAIIAFDDAPDGGHITTIDCTYRCAVCRHTWTVAYDYRELENAV